MPDKDQALLIKSDPSRLRQIFANLISNAFKFTHKGHVKYGYEIIDNNSIRFYVKDTGLGISKSYQQKIFERFIQEPKPLSTKKEGTGVGLPITQSLIRMLGGKIWVESSLGKGSTFYFELPEIVVSDHEKEDRKHQWKDKQVLIIEDEIKDFMKLEKILKNRVKIHFLNNAEQAIEFCSSKQQLDICLFRWKKGIDLSFIDNMRAISSLHIIVGLADAKSTLKEKERLKKHFDSVVYQPFTKKKILRVMEKYFG